MALLTSLHIDCIKIAEYLKHEVQIHDVYTQVLYREITERVAEEREISISAEEIQTEADKFRYEHKLESAAATFTWLQEQLLTPEDWEAGIRERLLSRKLAEHLFGRDVTTYFVQNKVQYDQAALYRLVVPYHALAQELYYQIIEEEISFYEAAHLYDIEEKRRLTCGFEGKVARWQLSPDLAVKVFGAIPKEVMAPISVAEGHELLMVEGFLPAELSSEVHQNILNQLFHEWLESELNYQIHSNQPALLNGNEIVQA